MRALVTGANTRMAYTVTKALFHKKVEVVVADFVPRSFTSFSRYARKHFRYPHPRFQEDDFVDCLLKRIKDLSCDVLIPTQEETYVIAKRQSDLEGTVEMALPSYEQILSVYCKDHLVELCGNLGVPVPRTRILKSISEIDEICENFQFPVVLKPRKGGGNFGIEHVKSPNGFSQRYLASLDINRFEPQDLLVQERIDVEKKFSQAFVYNQGKMIASFADIHWRDFPASGGSGTLRESIHRPDLEYLGRRVLDHLNWHGVAECEFVVEKGSCSPYLIEINPRIWGGINSAVSAGLNIAWMLYCIASGQSNSQGESNISYRDGVKTRWLWGDLRVFPDYYKMSQKKISFMTEYFNVLSKDVFLDDIDLHDPLPFLVLAVKKMFP